MRRLPRFPPYLLSFWLGAARALASSPNGGSDEEGLAAALSALRSSEQREAMLAAQPSLANAALVQALMRQANEFSEKGDFVQALNMDALAQTLARRLGDQHGLADALHRIGVIYQNQKSYRRANEYFRQSLSLAERTQYRGGVANVLVSTAFVQIMQGQLEQGLEAAEKGRAIAEEIGDREITAEALRIVAIGLDTKGDSPGAVETLQRSLKLLEAIGKQGPIARALGNLGSMYYWMGDHALALEYFQKSLSLGEQIGYRAWLPTVLNNIGNVYSARGNYAKALDCFQKSLELIAELGQKGWMAIELGNIADLHVRQGNNRQALAYFTKALSIFEEVEERPGIARTLSNIASVHAAQGEYTEALAYYQRAGKLLQGGDPVDLADALLGIGHTHALQGRYGDALMELQKSLKLYQKAGLQQGVAAALTELAHCYYAQRDYPKATDTAARAVDLAKRVGDSEVVVPALSVAGEAHWALGQSDLARQNFTEAIDTIERLRDQVVGGEPEHELFFESKVAPYYGMVSLLVAEQNSTEALAFAERAKGRVLLDVLRAGRLNITKAMTQNELAQEEKLAARLASLNMQISRENERDHPDRTRLSSLEGKLQEARLEYESFQTSLYGAHPDLRVQRGKVAPLNLEEVRPLLAGGKRALLEFVVGAKESFLFALTEEGEEGRAPGLKLRAYPLGMSSKQLSRQVQEFRQRLTSRTADPRGSGRKLYERLLGPAMAQLRGRTELAIVPDGPLWELPFQALPVSKDGFLVQDFAIFYAPSLAVLREMVKRKGEPAQPPPRTLLALGNPTAAPETVRRIEVAYRGQMLVPLLEAEKEVQALAQLYGSERSTVYTRSRAREDTLKSEAGNYQLIHLATHSILDDQNPLYSRVLLAQPSNEGSEDGLLEAWEVMKLNLHADLVVLSACQTARGRVGAGEGVIGMSWAFFVAGAPTLVVSQWEVDSASTTALMLEFHRNLIAGSNEAGGISRAEALRRAQLKLLQGKSFRRPFYWAAFVVMGNGA